MPFTERLRTHTLAKITDTASSALLFALLFPRSDLPPGVFEASASRLSDAHPRFAWAAAEIAAEIGAAPGVTVCSTTGLGIVWSEIHTIRVDNPNMAQHRGRLIARTGASFMEALRKEVAAAVSAACAEALRVSYHDELGKLKKAGKVVPRQRAVRSSLHGGITRAKRLERELRAEFEGVEDMGEEPSAAELRSVVAIMGLGVTLQQLHQALQGRAVLCRRDRMWDGIDTAEYFLRIGWLCASLKRFHDALALVPYDRPKSSVVTTEHGTFVGGRQLYDGASEDRQPEAPAPGDTGVIDDWLITNGHKPV